MPSFPQIRRPRGPSGGFRGTLALFLLLTVATFVLAGFVIADRREPEITSAKANVVAPQLDTIRPGATEKQVREAFGEPRRVITNAPGGGRCLLYTNLPSNQPAYRFCFEGGRLEVISAQ